MTTIPDDILAALDTDARAATVLALAAHQTTGRSASVTIKLTVRFDKDSGKTKIKGRVQASLPENDDDARTKKWAGVVLMTVETDHPGQQRLPT
jgi:hypothetical protein